MSGNSEHPVREQFGREATLVIDFGTCTSSAAVVVDNEAWLVPEPVSGSYSWPSAVFWDGQQLLVGTLAERKKRAEPNAYWAEFKRGLGQDAPMLLGPRRFRPIEQVVAMLSALRAEAQRRHGSLIERAVLTVPASYATGGGAGGDARRARMVAAAEAAGFTAVELLPEPVAAAFAPMTGAPMLPGQLVLVYDLGGGTFDTALVRIGDFAHEVLGHAALDNCGGSDVDGLLAGRIRRTGEPWLAPLMSNVVGEPGVLRLGMAISDFAQRVKHQLSDVAVVEDFLMPNTPSYRLGRPEFARLVAPLLSHTVQCCLGLLERLRVPVADVAAVLIVGGSSRMPVVAETLDRMLGLPLRRVEDPELAVVRGAARWLPRSGTRTVPAQPSPAGLIPLAFPIPGGSATLVRWLVGPGEAYPEGRALARARLPTGALWDLTAATPGRLDRILVTAGAPVTAHEWLALARP
jgi:molecular chaperone DnaK (HSP70)